MVSSYQRPYNKEELRKLYSDKADALLKDSVHLFRAETGIELIHKEPDVEEQVRIWKNWNLMTDEMKKISDEKSVELFGKNNFEHNKDIFKSLDKKIISFPKDEWTEIKKRFVENKLVYTIRVSEELGKYKQFDLLQTEGDLLLAVVSVDRIKGGIENLKKEYKFFYELDPKMLQEISMYKEFDVISLEAIEE